MSLETFFETNSAPAALGFIFQTAQEHEDLDMMQAVLEDIQNCKDNVMFLEYCMTLDQEDA
jgi:hypothetical protein